MCPCQLLLKPEVCADQQHTTPPVYVTTVPLQSVCLLPLSITCACDSSWQLHCWRWQPLHLAAKGFQSSLLTVLAGWQRSGQIKVPLNNEVLLLMHCGCRWCCGDMEHIDVSEDVFKLVSRLLFQVQTRAGISWIMQAA